MVIIQDKEESIIYNLMYRVVQDFVVIVKQINLWNLLTLPRYIKSISNKKETNLCVFLNNKSKIQEQMC
jgi:hypothetical protein